MWASRVAATERDPGWDEEQEAPARRGGRVHPVCEAPREDEPGGQGCVDRWDRGELRTGVPRLPPGAATGMWLASVIGRRMFMCPSG